MAEGPGPLDRRLDRRDFLERMTALTAAAAAGTMTGAATLAVPREVAAAEVAEAAGAAGASGGAAGSRGVSTLADLPLPDPATIQEADPTRLTLAEAASLLSAGRLTPVALVEAHLARIEALDGRLLAFNTVTADAALDRARRLGRGPWGGPLHGIPVALKDNYYTAGVATTANSRIFAGFVPDFDATAWARLRAAGAILLGKTQMGPLATTAATTPDGDRTTVNAWAPQDEDVSPGGSSSGSATAVAARMAVAATGTQTGGSITSPANAQGLTGLKPTMGRVSLHGIIPLTYTRDHPGPLARDAMDAAFLLQAMAGPDPSDPRTLGLPPVPDLVRAATPVEAGGRPGLRWPTRIGMFPGYLDPPDPSEVLPDPEQLQELDQEERRRREERARDRLDRRQGEAVARREMVETFRGLGAEVVEVEPPEEWEVLTSRELNNVRLPERTEPFLEHLRRDVGLFGVSLAPWINGLLLPATEYVRGQRAKLLLLRRILDHLFGACDVVLQDGPIPFDIVGLPLVAFPNGMAGGRPTGAILGGMPYAEDRLLSVVAAYQAVTDWHRRRAPEPPPAGSGGDAGPGGSSRIPPTRRRLQPRDVMLEGE